MRLPLFDVSPLTIPDLKAQLKLSLAIESETESLQWAASGSNVTLYLTAIDPIHVNIGSVLCPPTDVVPLASVFTARIIVFEIQVPITIGASVSRPDPSLESVIKPRSGRALSSLKRCSRFNIKAHLHARQSDWRNNQEEPKVGTQPIAFSSHSGSQNSQFSRVLAKSASAEVQLTLRSTGVSGPTARAQPIPLEPFSVNKEMGRVLIRRGGETIAAGR